MLLIAANPHLALPLWVPIETLVLAGVLVSLVVGGLLKATIQWLEKRPVRFKDAFVAAVIAVLPSLVIFSSVQPFLHAPGRESLAGVVTLAALLFGFFTQTLVVRWRFDIVFRRACLVSFVAGVLGLAAWAAFTIAALLVLPRASSQ